MILQETTVNLNDANSWDSYLREREPDSNFGTSNSMRVGFRLGQPENDNHYTYLKFNENILPTNNPLNIVSVHLKAYINLAPVDNTYVYFRQVNNNWNEANINWINQPTDFTSSGSTGPTITSLDLNTWADFNLTTIVLRWLQGTPNHGIILKTYYYDYEENSDRLLSFVQTEGDPVARRPKLEIKYLVPDDIAPSQPQTLTVTPDDWTNDNSFTLSWSNPFDHSGIIGAYYKIGNPPSSGSDYTKYVQGNEITSIDDIQATSPGISDIHVWLKDGENNANHENVSKVSIKYDPNPPHDFSPEANPSTWTSNKSPVISFNTTDDLSGIHYYRLKIDSGEFQNETNPHQLDTLEEGEHTVTIRAFDNADNFKDGTVSVFIDSIPPEAFSAQADEIGWTNNIRPTIYFDTSDETSGIHHYEIQADSTVPVTINNSNYYQLPSQDDGEHIVKVKALDYANNWVISSINIYIDATNPYDLLITPDYHSWTNESSPIITYGGSDDTSGIEAYHLIIDNRSAIILSIENSTYQLSTLPDGIHSIKLIAIDKANNSI